MAFLSYQIATDEVPYKAGATYWQGPFYEGAKILSDIGYSGLELMTVSPAAVNKEKLKETLSVTGQRIPLICTGEIGSAGYTVSNINMDQYQRSISRISEAIDLAAYFGANINAGKIKGWYDPQIPNANTYARAVQGFREICDYASNKHVEVYLETAGFTYMNFINTCEEAVALIREVNRENFKLMMDVYHMYMEEKSVIESIHTYASFTRHVHLADNNRMYPGACGMNFDDILKVFHESAYDAAYTVEARQLPNQYICAERSYQYLGPRLEQLYGREK